MQEDEETLLTVNSLAYQYAGRVAVDGIHFSIRKPEVLGLLGPNGAGKTTTIACIAGLLSNWNGDMLFLGRSFRPATTPSDRARLGLVPQELAIYPNLTAEENLRFFATVAGLPKREIPEAIKRGLELSGLTDRRHDLVRTFSGGMQRRLNLVAGLMHDPELVLLDEPTVGVDPQSRNHIFETLIQLRCEGQSILYTTHYMEEAQRLCDRIAIMNEGKIAAVGTHQELARQIGNPQANLEQVFLQLTGRSLRDE